MSKQDKVVAVAGVILIIILALVAVLLFFSNRKDGFGGLKKDNTVELNDVVVETAKEYQNTDDKSGVAEDKKTDSDGQTDDANTKNSIITEKYAKASLKQVKNSDKQLEELAYYWEDYQLEAVSDLIRLERIRTFTNDLKGTNKYYYYGDVDENNIPNGRGLAIYENDTYYYGDWSKGIRDGNGMWLRIYLGKSGKEGKYTGVVEHQYNGQFKNDLPNGTGQEHYTFNMEEITYDLTILNALGNYKNGYYDGEMYFMTGDTKGNRYDWYAKANAGVFEYCVPDKVSTTNKRPVWTKGEDNDHSTDESDDGFYWMTDSENSSYGIYGLKK